MVDQEGANVVDEMERTYANAGNASMGRVPVTRQRPAEDERMPEEWNRAMNQEGNVVGYIGQRPIRRPAEQDTELDNQLESGWDTQTEATAGVMAALARLRQEK